jgi:hypothetical protein
MLTTECTSHVHLDCYKELCDKVRLAEFFIKAVGTVELHFAPDPRWQTRITVCVQEVSDTRITVCVQEVSDTRITVCVQEVSDTRITVCIQEVSDTRARSSDNTVLLFRVMTVS